MDNRVLDDLLAEADEVISKETKQEKSSNELAGPSQNSIVSNG